MIWKKNSPEMWSIVDSIIGDIEKICFVGTIRGVDVDCTFGFVLATSTSNHLVGVKMDGEAV